ncbi:MAG: hypothetical protein GY696_23605, partial [Gammaproteobacteria bacterium]|nr:hypothetical protein [Gammaproteobacteria bacterium]
MENHGVPLHIGRNQSDDDDWTQKHFQKTVRMESRRWMSTWPWKDKNPYLLTNEALVLNEWRYRGDVMHPDSIGVIRRFPPKKIGITADTEKAFLMDTINFPCLKDHPILSTSGFSPGLQFPGQQGLPPNDGLRNLWLRGVSRNASTRDHCERWIAFGRRYRKTTFILIL